MHDLMQLIQTLRGENGCPWDRQQQAKDVLNYLIEEVYELADVILADNAEGIEEELGDVLFQILFLARLYEEQGKFTLRSAAEGILAKMIHRHPHVFGNESLETAAAVKQRWRSLKMEEKKTQPASILDSIPVSLPALARAYLVSERAGGVGFDWRDIAGVMAKVEEEWDELKSELSSADRPEERIGRASVEFGDVLFSMVNVARFAQIHPETALAESVRKFEQRFRYMEQRILETGETLETAFSDEIKMDALWEQAKNMTKHL